MTEVLLINSVKIAVILISDRCGNIGGRDTFAQHFGRERHALFEHVLFDGNPHFFLKQMAKRGLRTCGVECKVIERHFFAQMLVDIFCRPL